MNRIIGIVILIILIAGGWYIFSNRPIDTETAQVQENTYSFVYHDDEYVRVPVIESDVPGNTFASGYMIFDRVEYEAFLNSTEPREGPPAISVMVYNNPNGYTSEEWVMRETLLSNYQQGQVLNSITVDGVEGVRYVTDGLYMSNNVVFESDGRIYVISGSYIETNSAIVDEFNFIVENFEIEDDIAGPSHEGVSPLALYFGMEMTKPVSPDGPIPIEGYDAGLLLGRYSGLLEEDFDGVEALQGVYNIEDEELVFTLEAEAEHSAARTISPEGYETLLDNLIDRLELTIDSEESVDALIITLQ